MLNNLNQNLGSSTVFSGIENEFQDPLKIKNQNTSDPARNFLISVLIIVIVLSISCFFYIQQSLKSLAEKKNSLEMLNNNPALQYFENNLDNIRLIASKNKLINSVYENRYFVSSMLFPILENSVESSKNSYVFFNKFSFKKGNSQNISSVFLSGIALDLETLSRQIDRFKKSNLSPYFLNFKVNNVSFDDQGYVNFDISFDIDVSTKSYINFVKENTQSNTELEFSNNTNLNANLSSSSLNNKNNNDSFMSKNNISKIKGVFYDKDADKKNINSNFSTSSSNLKNSSSENFSTGNLEIKNNLNPNDIDMYIEDDLDNIQNN